MTDTTTGRSVLIVDDNGTVPTRFAQALADAGQSIRHGVDVFATYDPPAPSRVTVARPTKTPRNRKERRAQAARARKC